MITDPGVFPLTLHDEELQWNIALDYDVQGDTFTLRINDQAFLEMPKQVEVTPSAPQNIEKGTIKLN